jgi:hypothetical protein
MYHPQQSAKPHNYDDQPMSGLVTANAFLASKVLNENANRSESIYRTGSSVSNRDIFGLTRNEIAFEVKGAVPQYPGDFGRNLGGQGATGPPVQQHSRSSILTSLNGFETKSGALRRAQLFINSMQSLSRDDAEELLRDIVASKIEYRGINITDHKSQADDAVGYGSNMVAVTLQVAGVCTLPVLKSGIRIGSFVEAVPMTPSEHEMFSTPRFSSRGGHQKAKLIIRELKRQSVINSMLRNISLFMDYYPQMVAAYGSDAQTMQRFAALQGIQRFALFSGIRTYALINSNAAMGAGDANVITPLLGAVRAALGGGANLTADQLERTLAAALGVVNSSIVSNDPLERAVSQHLAPVQTREKWMKFSKDATRRVIFAGTINGDNREHIHGINDLAAMGPGGAWSTNATTGQKMPDVNTLGGRVLQLQLNQPRDLLETCLSSFLCQFRNVIGVAISSAAYAQDVSKCSVLLQNSGVVQ